MWKTERNMFVHDHYPYDVYLRLLSSRNSLLKGVYFSRRRLLLSFTLHYMETLKLTSAIVFYRLTCYKTPTFLPAFKGYGFLVASHSAMFITSHLVGNVRTGVKSNTQSRDKNEISWTYCIF